MARQAGRSGLAGGGWRELIQASDRGGLVLKNYADGVDD
jgi:hypothetical protein